MPSIREHLDSPQFPAEEPMDEDEINAARQAKGPMSLLKLTSGWVAPGVPRWRAYVIYGLSLVTGLFLMLTPGPDGFDFLAFGGILLTFLGVFGLLETVTGRKLWRP